MIQIAEAWRRAVWTPESALPPTVVTHLRAWETAVRAFGRDLVLLRASALTYRTLLSLVPFLAVSFALLGSFGGLQNAEEALRRRLLQNLAPGAAASVSEALSDFLTRVSSGAVSGIGVLVLVFTVVSLLTAVETSFNHLWEVEKARPFLERFVTYWAMVTVGPVLFALSFSMTSAARSHVLILGIVDRVPGAAWVVPFAFSLVPWVITCLAMTMLFFVVPNTRVRPRAAIGGGVVAGTLWEGGKLVFTWASANLFSYDAVYGGFAALAVLLVWLQIGWVIILLGCKTAYGLQHERALLDQRTAVALGHAERELLAVRCMVEVARSFLSGSPPPTAETLAVVTGVFEVKKEVLNHLEARGLVVSVDPERRGLAGTSNGRDEAYVPAQDPSGTTLNEVLDAFRYAEPGHAPGPAPLPAPEADPVAALLSDLGRRYHDAVSSAFGGLTLAEAVDRLPRPAPAEGRRDRPPVR